MESFALRELREDVHYVIESDLGFEDIMNSLTSEFFYTVEQLPNLGTLRGILVTDPSSGESDTFYW